MKANLHLYLYYIYISNPFLAINPSRFAKYGLIGTGTRVLVMTPSPCFIRVFVIFFEQVVGTDTRIPPSAEADIEGERS